MKRIFYQIFIVLASLALIFAFQKSSLIKAEPNCDNPGPGDLDYCIQKIQSEIDAIKPAQEKNKQELAGLNSQISKLSREIDTISAQLSKTEKDISQREEDLAYAKELFDVKTTNHYKFLRLYDPIAPFLFSSDASEAFREITFRQRAADEDRQIMNKYADDLAQLKKDKDNLEKNQTSLAAAKKSLDDRAKVLGAEVAKVESYIASLSAKQQQFIAQKLGSLNLPTTLGAGPLYCTDDRNLNPGFSPAYAFYTYGIPHRVGMNQYGAYGRASSGQNYDQILHAYFNFDSYQDGVNTTIRVNNGNGVNQGSVIWSGSLDDYVRRIYEIPASWPAEALKAQAIAARSYALAVTNNGADSICANQNCQVFKTDPKGGAWDQAVSETSGKVMKAGGQIITAWYSSTDGGYTFPNNEVWGGGYLSWTKNLRDTNSGVSSFSDLQSSSYDKDSPCFYAAQGWRNEYGKSAWLKPEEVADIANVILLARHPDVDKRHLYQTDKPNPEGVETWSADQVKQELSQRGDTPINSASSVTVTGVDFGSGKTTQVTINGKPFPGEEFRNWFNLRAPANIQIVGPLFNVEKK